jgi:hypothetical protein
MRRVRPPLACLLGVLLLMAMSAPARADVRVTGVAPARAAGQLACRLSLAGLPDERQLQSMRSGLLAAVELDLTVVREDGRVAAARTLALRLGFDLWDEVFSVAGTGLERRFASLEALRAWLAAPEPLPVAPWPVVADGARYRLHVAVVTRAVATDERERVGDLIAGGSAREPARTDRQEASVSLGRLIRFFYQGGGDGREGLEAASPWFRAGEVADEAH